MLRQILREAIRNVLSEANETAEQKINQMRKVGKDLNISVFNVICLVDPTSDGLHAGKYFDWIYNNYDEITEGSMESVRDALNIVQRLKGVNIQTMSVADLMDMMKQPEMISISWRNKLKEYEGQYEIMWQNGNWVIVHPKTWDAERFFGQHTEWCTVGDEDYFNDYGNLYIIIPIKNGIPDVRSKDKWQISDNEGDVCMADVYDGVYCSVDEFFDEYPHLADREVADALFKIDNNFFSRDNIATYYMSLGVPEEAIYEKDGDICFEYNGMKSVSSKEMYKELVAVLDNVEPRDYQEQQFLEEIADCLELDEWNGFFEYLCNLYIQRNGDNYKHLMRDIKQYFTDPSFLYNNDISHDDIRNALRSVGRSYGEMRVNAILDYWNSFYSSRMEALMSQYKIHVCGQRGNRQHCLKAIQNILILEKINGK